MLGLALEQLSASPRSIDSSNRKSFILWSTDMINVVKQTIVRLEGELLVDQYIVILIAIVYLDLNLYKQIHIIMIYLKWY